MHRLVCCLLLALKACSASIPGSGEEGPPSTAALPTSPMTAVQERAATTAATKVKSTQIPTYTWTTINITATECPRELYPIGPGTKKNPFGTVAFKPLLNGTRNFTFYDHGVGLTYPTALLPNANETNVYLHFLNTSRLEYVMPSGARAVIDDHGFNVYTPDCKQKAYIPVQGLFTKAKAYKGNKKRRVQLGTPSEERKSPTKIVDAAKRDYTLIPVNIKVLDQCGALVPDLQAQLLSGQFLALSVNETMYNEPGSGTYYQTPPWLDPSTLKRQCQSSTKEVLDYVSGGVIADLCDSGTAMRFIGKAAGKAAVGKIALATLGVLELPLVAAAVDSIVVFNLAVRLAGGSEAVAETFCDQRYKNYRYEIDSRFNGKPWYITDFPTLPTPVTTIKKTIKTSVSRSACPTPPARQYSTVNLIKDASFENQSIVGGYPLLIGDVTYRTDNAADGHSYIRFLTKYSSNLRTTFVPRTYPIGTRINRPLQFELSYRLAITDNGAACQLGYGAAGLLWNISFSPSSTTSGNWTRTTVQGRTQTSGGPGYSLQWSCVYPGRPTPTPSPAMAIDVDDIAVYGLDLNIPGQTLVRSALDL